MDIDMDCFPLMNYLSLINGSFLQPLILKSAAVLSNTDLAKSSLGQTLLSCIDAIPVPVTARDEGLNSMVYCGWRGVRKSGAGLRVSFGDLGGYEGRLPRTWTNRTPTCSALPETQATCNGTTTSMKTINALSGAFDFGATSGPSGLHATVLYNVSLPPTEPPTNYRIAALLNAAIRGWARHIGLSASSSTSAGPALDAPIGVELLGLMSFPKATNALTFDL